MEVIVNSHTPLTVKDSEGNVLFEWIPKTNKVTVKEYSVKKDTAEIDPELLKQLIHHSKLDTL